MQECAPLGAGLERVAIIARQQIDL